MRKWHRWTSLFAGFFMLWMAVTGIIIHANDILGESKGPPPAAAPVLTADGTPFVCPPDYMCRPKPKEGKLSFAGLIKHMHSGEIAGPVGTVLSILSGLALLFFAVSGIWLYVQMWSFRKSKNLRPRWLWK